MKNLLSIILILFFSLCIFLGGLFFYEHKNFPIHFSLNQQFRHKHQSLKPASTMKIISIGHSKAYADFLWITMIQYIGNNISKGDFSEYSVKLIERITELSPKFSTAYEWAMWLMPIPQNANLSYTDEQRNTLTPSLAIAQRGIQSLCDMEKIHKIDTIPVHDIQKSLAILGYINPCKSGMLPYLIAFYGGQLMGNHQTAERFYKIASFHQDTPEVSPILAIISGKPKDNPRAIAENFALMAIGGHDIDPYPCVKSTDVLLGIINKKTISLDEIKLIENSEKNLPRPVNGENIGTQSCYDFYERAVKYTYLSFINEEAKKYPNISDIHQLLSAIGLSDIPTTQSQDNMTLTKNNNLWEYVSK